MSMIVPKLFSTDYSFLLFLLNWLSISLQNNNKNDISNILAFLVMPLASQRVAGLSVTSYSTFSRTFIINTLFLFKALQTLFQADYFVSNKFLTFKFKILQQ